MHLNIAPNSRAPIPRTPTAGILNLCQQPRTTSGTLSSIREGGVKEQPCMWRRPALSDGRCFVLGHVVLVACGLTMYTGIQTHIHMHTPTHTDLHIYVYTQKYIYIYTDIYIYVHTYTYIDICICTHAHLLICWFALMFSLRSYVCIYFQMQCLFY